MNCDVLANANKVKNTKQKWYFLPQGTVRLISSTLIRVLITCSKIEKKGDSKEK